MNIHFFLKPLLLPLFFCFFITTCVPLHAQSEAKNSHVHDARKLRKHTYSSLYWFLISSFSYYKTYENYPLTATIIGIFALNNCINMLHYYHESQYAALEEERAFDIIKNAIIYHGTLPEYLIHFQQ